MLELNEIDLKTEEQKPADTKQNSLHTKIIKAISRYKSQKSRKKEVITQNRQEDIVSILELCATTENEDLLNEQLKSYLNNNLYHNYTFWYFRSWSSAFKESLLSILNWHDKRTELVVAKRQIIALKKQLRDQKKLLQQSLLEQKELHDKTVTVLNKKIESLSNMVDSLSAQVRVLENSCSLEKIKDLHNTINTLQQQIISESQQKPLPAVDFDRKKDNFEEKEPYVFVPLNIR